MDLNIIWFFILVVVVIGYAILDGFDLGVGVLYYSLGKTEKEKRTLMNSIGPVWEGNEVWLITAIGALLAAFPNAYATIFSGFYLLMIIILFGLIFRAVAIEYYFKTEDDKRLQGLLEKLFVGGSIIPTLSFGIVVGNMVVGIELDTMQNYVGSFISLFNPYALIIGVVGLILFLLQGATYTIVKTENELQGRAISLSKKLAIVTLLAWLVSVGATYYFAPQMFDNYTNHWILFIIPILTLVSFIALIFFLNQKRYFAAFLSSSLVVLTKVLTVGVGLFPNIVFGTNPNTSLTIYNASSTNLTLTVMLVILIIGLPLVLTYSTYVHYTFRGKASSDRVGY